MLESESYVMTWVKMKDLGHFEMSDSCFKGKTFVVGVHDHKISSEHHKEESSF